MWKASFGPILTVHVAEPELIEQVLRQEGQHPMRSDLSSWKDYRKLRGEGYGLLTAWVQALGHTSIYSRLHACSLSFMIQLKHWLQEPVLHALHLTHQGSIYSNYRLLQVLLGNSKEWLMRTEKLFTVLKLYEHATLFHTITDSPALKRRKCIIKVISVICLQIIETRI